MSKPILCVDWDGVIHSYRSGWKGAAVIPDPPVPGALLFLNEALDTFRVAIFSSRSNQPGGIAAMHAKLREWAIAGIEDGMWRDDPMLCWLDMIEWPTEKPPAFITIDDRALTFEGTWPAIATLPSSPKARPIPAHQRSHLSLRSSISAPVTWSVIAPQ